MLWMGGPAAAAGAAAAAAGGSSCSLQRMHGLHTRCSRSSTCYNISNNSKLVVNIAHGGPLSADSAPACCSRWARPPRPPRG